MKIATFILSNVSLYVSYVDIYLSHLVCIRIRDIFNEMLSTLVNISWDFTANKKTCFSFVNQQ